MTVNTHWHEVLRRLEQATGPDTAIDDALECPQVTASAETARAWAAARLPGWHAHLGFDVSGVLPYVAFTRGGVHVEASAPTVSLAILRAAVRVLAGEFGQ